MADDLSVDNSEPAIFLLFHFPPRRSDLFQILLRRISTVESPLFVVALHRSIGPESAPPLSLFWRAECPGGYASLDIASWETRLQGYRMHVPAHVWMCLQPERDLDV